MVLFLLTCATTWLTLIAGWCLIGATPRGQQWTHALRRPHVHDGLSVLLMAVLCTFRRPSICRPMHRPFMRNELLDVTTIVPATACHQRNYIDTYSRYILEYAVYCIFGAPGKNPQYGRLIHGTDAIRSARPLRDHRPTSPSLRLSPAFFGWGAAKARCPVQHACWARDGDAGDRRSPGAERHRLRPWRHGQTPRRRWWWYPGPAVGIRTAAGRPHSAQFGPGLQRIQHHRLRAECDSNRGLPGRARLDRRRNGDNQWRRHHHSDQYDRSVSGQYIDLGEHGLSDAGRRVSNRARWLRRGRRRRHSLSLDRDTGGGQHRRCWWRRWRRRQHAYRRLSVRLPAVRQYGQRVHIFHRLHRLLALCQHGDTRWRG